MKPIRTPGEFMNAEQCKADAKLREAAEELLEALILLMDAINPHSHPNKTWSVNEANIGSKTMPDDQVIIKALQAIKKATE